MPGPSLTIVGFSLAASSTNSNDGLKSLMSYLRLLIFVFASFRSRLAGSINKPSNSSKSILVTSACSTFTFSKRARLYVAIAAVTSSSSNAVTSISRLARARVSAPMPQPKSAIRFRPFALNLPA